MFFVLSPCPRLSGLHPGRCQNTRLRERRRGIEIFATVFVNVVVVIVIDAVVVLTRLTLLKEAHSKRGFFFFSVSLC